MDEKRIKRKNTFKVIRSVLETLIILAVVLWGLWSLVEYRRQSRVMTDSLPVTCVMIPSDEIVFGYESAGKAQGEHFVALSYNGITENPRVGGKIVTKASFEKQIEALKASGYQTITQQDVINFYRNNDPLPDRALLLILEDGIMNSAELAQPELVKNNYIATVCTFAQNMSDAHGLYITAEEAKMLNQTSYWETGSNGYRLSYINVFDRFENYFGHLNTAEFLDIHNYLRRDYNHYLMDFLRDENRLRTESVSEMEERIAWDYEKMNEIYRDELGFVPGLYILMHSNTGAFGNDPLVSMKNAEMMEKYVTQPTGKASAWPIFGYTINDGVMIQSAIDDLGAATYNIDMVPVSHYNSIAAIMKDYPVEVVEGKMDSRWNYPAVRSINDVPMTFAINPLGLWITTEGERVVNESAFHVAWRLGAHYWSLWGQDEINDIRENGFPYVESTRAFGQGGFDANMPLPELDEILDKCVDMGVLYRASSIEELAKMINVDAATLSGVIADYNSACEAGEDAVMGKGAENLRPVTGDTYYAFKCINYTYGTDGGLDVDEQLNVLREDGSVIDGLYATGYDCSGVLYNSNKAYVDYGGAALGWGFTSGRLAGQNAVEAING